MLANHWFEVAEIICLLNAKVNVFAVLQINSLRHSCTFPFSRVLQDVVDYLRAHFQALRNLIPQTHEPLNPPTL
jgi:hypothetical protein